MTPVWLAHARRRPLQAAWRVVRFGGTAVVLAVGMASGFVLAAMFGG